jgi:hypothetical protein
MTTDEQTPMTEVETGSVNEHSEGNESDEVSSASKNRGRVTAMDPALMLAHKQLPTARLLTPILSDRKISHTCQPPNKTIMRSLQSKPPWPSPDAFAKGTELTLSRNISHLLLVWSVRKLHLEGEKCRKQPRKQKANRRNRPSKRTN